MPFLLSFPVKESSTAGSTSKGPNDGGVSPSVHVRGASCSPRFVTLLPFARLWFASPPFWSCFSGLRSFSLSGHGIFLRSVDLFNEPVDDQSSIRREQRGHCLKTLHIKPSF
ncbi:hypothetical protein HN51_042259 [Arachis hypogaea]